MSSRSVVTEAKHFSTTKRANTPLVKNAFAAREAARPPRDRASRGLGWRCFKGTSSPELIRLPFTHSSPISDAPPITVTN